FNLARGVNLGIEAAFSVRSLFNALGLAEIDPAGEFAHDEEVDAKNYLPFERRGVCQHRIEFGRAQVGVEPELLAQPEQRPLWPDGVIQTFPLGTADCAEKNCIALFRELEGGGRQWPSGLINRGASHVGGPK